LLLALAVGHQSLADAGGAITEGREYTEEGPKTIVKYPEWQWWGSGPPAGARHRVDRRRSPCHALLPPGPQFLRNIGDDGESTAAGWLGLPRMWWVIPARDGSAAEQVTMLFLFPPHWRRGTPGISPQSGHWEKARGGNRVQSLISLSLPVLRRIANVRANLW